MSFSIRQATSADASVIVEFNRLLAEESEGKILDLHLLTAGVAAGLADATKAIYFVAVEDGAVIGQLMLTREWSDWRNGWFWWIQSVYVRPESRCQGVFRALYEHVRNTAIREPDVIGLRLYVEEENKDAQQVYQRMGMEWTSYLMLERYPM